MTHFHAEYPSISSRSLMITCFCYVMFLQLVNNDVDAHNSFPLSFQQHSIKYQKLLPFEGFFTRHIQEETRYLWLVCFVSKVKDMLQFSLSKNLCLFCGCLQRQQQKHTIKYTQYERVRFSLGTFCTPKNRRHTNKKRNVIR